LFDRAHQVALPLQLPKGIFITTLARHGNIVPLLFAAFLLLLGIGWPVVAARRKP